MNSFPLYRAKTLTFHIAKMTVGSEPLTLRVYLQVVLPFLQQLKEISRSPLSCWINTSTLDIYRKKIEWDRMTKRIVTRMEAETLVTRMVATYATGSDVSIVHTPVLAFCADTKYKTTIDCTYADGYFRMTIPAKGGTTIMSPHLAELIHIYVSTLCQ